jgi:hypothetical protein
MVTVMPSSCQSWFPGVYTTGTPEACGRWSAHSTAASDGKLKMSPARTRRSTRASRAACSAAFVIQEEVRVGDHPDPNVLANHRTEEPGPVAIEGERPAGRAAGPSTSCPFNDLLSGPSSAPRERAERASTAARTGHSAAQRERAGVAAVRDDDRRGVANAFTQMRQAGPVRQAERAVSHTRIGVRVQMTLVSPRPQAPAGWCAESADDSSALRGTMGSIVGFCQAALTSRPCSDPVGGPSCPRGRGRQPGSRPRALGHRPCRQRAALPTSASLSFHVPPV